MHFTSLGRWCVPHLQFWTWAGQEWPFPVLCQVRKIRRRVSTGLALLSLWNTTEQGGQVEACVELQKIWHVLKIFFFFVLPEKSRNQCSEVAWLRTVVLYTRFLGAGGRGVYSFIGWDLSNCVAYQHGQIYFTSLLKQVGSLPCFYVINEVFVVCCGVIFKYMWNSKTHWWNEKQ